MSETKKGKKPSQQVSAISKDAKDALNKLENDINSALKQLQSYRPSQEQIKKSADEVRSQFENRVSQLQSLIDKYIANANVSSDLKAEVEKIRKQIPELRNKLGESIEKGTTEIYTKHIKVFVGDVGSALKRLRSKIGY